jgi:hypothetical protein
LRLMALFITVYALQINGFRDSSTFGVIRLKRVKIMNSALYLANSLGVFRF